MTNEAYPGAAGAAAREAYTIAATYWRPQSYDSAARAWVHAYETAITAGARHHDAIEHANAAEDYHRATTEAAEATHRRAAYNRAIRAGAIEPLNEQAAKDANAPEEN